MTGKSNTVICKIEQELMVEVGKTNSQLPTFTNFSTEHSYKNTFTRSARANFSCLYFYSVVAQGKPKRFYPSLCESQGFPW